MARLAPLLVAACAAPARLELPPRSPSALPGSAVVGELAGLDLHAREARVWRELGHGNLPRFLRTLVPITVTRPDARGRMRTVRYAVTPDYLALGGDDDFCRIPMTPALGQRIADRLGCSLPTRRVVDDAWHAARVRLEPVTFHPEQYDITAPDRFLAHQRGIELQRAGQPLGSLVAGVKKDVVVTPRLATRADRVAIYGWHRADGRPIQPLSTVHVDWYTDYSHGVRLVHDRVLVDGRPMAYAQVLADPVLHPLLSDEGAFSPARYPTAPR